MSCINRIVGIPCNSEGGRSGIRDCLIAPLFKYPALFHNEESGQVDRIFAEHEGDSRAEWDVFRPFKVTKNQSWFTQSTTYDPTTGVKNTEQTIYLNMPTLDTHKRQQLVDLVGKPVMIALRDRRWRWFVFGEWGNLTCVQLDADSGQSETDFSGFKLIFKANSEDIAREANWIFSRDLEKALKGEPIE